jgi:hypothetical protein
MKSLIKLLTLCSFMGFLFTSCEGPMGPAGKDANESCLICHNTPNMSAKESEYEVAAHHEGNPRTGKYCARCHTSEGFIEITGKPWATGALISATNDVNNATRISCATCHKHSTFDFEGDTVSQVLRTIAPVSLNYNNNSKTTDFGPINNLCATCHQIRGVTTPTVYKNSADSIAKKADTNWKQLPFFPLTNSKEGTTVKYQVGQSISVHDGNQSNLFTGINGYEYAGKTYTRTWKHSALSCIDCHMNKYNPADTTGGHTFKPNKAECTSCHSGSDKLTPVKNQISGKLTELGDLLAARKVFKKTTSGTTVSYSALQSHDYYGVLFPTTSSTTNFGMSLTSYNTVSPTTGLVVYASTVKLGPDTDFGNRIGREWKYGELGAAYNFFYIRSESPSGTNYGVHNPVYALQLLQNSIDWLKAN